jgi:hypothetical protein
MELPANRKDAVEALLLLDDQVFREIGEILEILADAYCEAAAIKNGEIKGRDQ